MKASDYKAHFAQVAKRVQNIKEPFQTVSAGFDLPLGSYRVIGYLHKTRIHKTDLKLTDYNFVRYMFKSDSAVHYAEAEVCILDKRKTKQIIRKILILEL